VSGTSVTSAVLSVENDHLTRGWRRAAKRR
jgi:hypothetical protein